MLAAPGQTQADSASRHHGPRRHEPQLRQRDVHQPRRTCDSDVREHGDTHANADDDTESEQALADALHSAQGIIVLGELLIAASHDALPSAGRNR